MNRPPKPLAVHQADGTGNVTRHRSRVEQHFAHGAPEPPDGLSLDAVRLWRQVVAGMPPAVLCEVDWAGLAECVRWQETSAYLTTLLTQGDISVIDAAAKASNQFRQWASRFGLTPVDRARLSSTAATNTTENPFEKLKAIS